MRCGPLDVLAHATGYVFRLLLAHVLHGLGGDAYYEAAGRVLLALWDEGAGGDYGPLAYLRAVEDGGAHAYEAAFLYLAAVHDGPVADDAVVTDDSREAGVGVQDAAVLDVGAGTDPDRLRVAPQHGPVPDARLLCQVNVPDHVRSRRDPRGRRDLRIGVAVGEQVGLFVAHDGASPGACSSRNLKRRRRNSSGLSTCGVCPQSGMASSRYAPPDVAYASRTARIWATIGWGG